MESRALAWEGGARTSPAHRAECSSRAIFHREELDMRREKAPWPGVPIRLVAEVGYLVTLRFPI